MTLEERFEWYYGGHLDDRDTMLELVLQMEPDFEEDLEEENEDEEENEEDIS